MKINKKNSFKIPPLPSPEWIEIKPLFYNLFIFGVPLTDITLKHSKHVEIIHSNTFGVPLTDIILKYS
jgi:hypothetical protein